MPILRQRHAKILATVGPACDNKEKIKQLVEAGADAFRLNFSHGSHSDHRNNIENIRSVSEEVGYHIPILQDLQGPKIRIGILEPVTLEVGDVFTLDDNPEEGNKDRVHLPHPEILEVLQKGDMVFINDGLVRLEVTGKTGNTAVHTQALSSGVVSSRKGVNLPGVDLPMSALTEKDKTDLEFGLQQGVDWVALSFVQRASDVEELQALVQGKANIMAKIEMPNAVERLDEILKLVDAVMIARGDLGVEVPLEEVPSIQKKIIRMCREVGKPVVTATQMLESMTQNPQPTRAEVSDVANATYEGSDVLMLSAESASGKYPVEAVQTMSNVITRVERSSAWRPLMDARHPQVGNDVSDAITNAAFNLTESIDTCAVVTFTETGGTALRMSRQRPVRPLFVITPNAKVARQINLSWGCNARVSEKPQNVDHLLELAENIVRNEGVAEEGSNIVVTAGVPLNQPGSTNMVRVVTL